MTRALGKTYRNPGAPALSKTAAMLSAWPMHTVYTGGLCLCWWWEGELLVTEKEGEGVFLKSKTNKRMKMYSLTTHAS
jgi:hypothetical protein